MPADPQSAERDPYEADEADEAELPADAFDRAALQSRGDVAGLLALAKAYRAGSAPGGRDLAKCLEAYRAAAELGSGEAEYGVALFVMNGGTVAAQDLKEGTMRLRSAAEKGSVPAKVYLGNLYELGIHYKADAEKADVWYRNAGRAAHIDAEPGAPDWNRALAELGCARHVLALTKEPALDEDDKKRLLTRARAHGLGLRVRDDAAEDAPRDRATFVEALTGAEASNAPLAPSTPSRKPNDTVPETKQALNKTEPLQVAGAPRPGREALAKAKPRSQAGAASRLALALGAFGYALLFVLAGVGAGYAATLGARELVAHGHALPGLGDRAALAFPIVLGVIGVLPALLVYRFGAVFKALVMGAALAGVGWVAWGTGGGALHGDRTLQALTFGLGGFLAGLLVLGLLGGAKPAKRPK